MTDPTAHDRLHHLGAAFDELAKTTRGLSVLRGHLAPSDDREAGGEHWTVHLVGRTTPQVTLVVGERGADVQTRGTEHAGEAFIHDCLSVDLSRGYRWDDAVCASADELAHLLLKHMLRRLDSASDLRPRR
jgi:hypothetical protein